VITFCTETYAQCIVELKERFPRHWEELALDKDEFPLDPQYEVYQERERKGELFLVVGRDKGEMCAYFVGFIAPGLHYRTCRTLTMDIFWLAPEHRGKYAGIRLFKVVEQEAQRRGVDRIFVGSKLHKDAGWLFSRMGYKPVETYYSKLVGRD
jgi:GNAT superfamily N-acetyltransferase